MRKAIITCGLGFGDEGKGQTVDYLCRKHNAKLVIRYSGGAQAGHNVQLPNGHRHTFAQFGAGTFAGAATYLGSAVIIKPCGIRREAQALADAGVKDPHSMLTVHGDCLVATPYHQMMNRIREMNREFKHGSCGVGIGETRKYWLQYGDDAIYARDVAGDLTPLRRKLELLRQRMWAEIQESELEYDIETFIHAIDSWIVAKDLRNDMLGVNMADHPKRVDGLVIFEASQGVLLDETFGFHPHTTWSTVTTHHAEEMCQFQFDQVERLGITRAYHSRHGAGPLPTYSEELTEHAVDPGNPQNPWQGSIRMGWLDMELLRYAVKHCGSKLDGIVVNHLDQLPSYSKYCTHYKSTEHNDIGMWWKTPYSLAGQREKGDRLAAEIPRYSFGNGGAICSAIDKLAPVVITSQGPTHEDRRAVL